MRANTLKTEVLKVLQFAGCPVRHALAVTIVSQKLGRPITIEAYIAALDSLGTKIIRVRGASAIAENT
jgi:hypothetical protein